ncbi:MAG: transglycosylase SLT domain-containing protein [Gemmatimonadota bacterium]
MTARILLTSAVLLTITGAARVSTPPPPDTGSVFVAEADRWAAASDSARDELEAGRYWHAALILRAEGAADGGPSDVLLLAEAEAGWENWPAVRDLLSGADWVDTYEDPRGLYLLGRAFEHGAAWSDAASAFTAYAARTSEAEGHARASDVRSVRSLWNSGAREEALGVLTELRSAPHLRSWVAVELALGAVEAGDPDGVLALAGHAVEPRAARALWRAEADALLNAGDSAGAMAAFEELGSLGDEPRAAAARVEHGRLIGALGDDVASRAVLLGAYEDAQGSARTRAAASLVDLGDHDFDAWLSFGRVLDRAGEGGRALRAYDRAHALAEEGERELSLATRVERSRLMSTVPARQADALEEFRAVREVVEDERTGARNLELWAQMRRRQGLSSQESTLRRWLLEDYPASPEAAEVVWRQGSSAESNGAFDRALERYAFVAEHARTHSRAGQARMRSGQIHLRRGNVEAAAGVYEAYLADFPNGRRWQEAAYWAGRSRLDLGEADRGRAHLEHVLTQPIEYYAVMAADLLDVDFELDLPLGAAAVEPGWLSEGLARLDALDDAGLGRGAESEVARLRERADGTRGPRLRLAEALIERGRTIDGINLGWALLRDEGGWDQQILHVTYPFPYEELVRREAADWGIDPFMMAAIIRQESAFKADIVSHAGAIGLMQVMPPTGAELARAYGPDGFTRESLTKPEVNLHLGAAFFVDMSRRYDNELPIVLSAYNAGPTRATRWRRYPEASDPLRFTERIPFTETRGYVKSVRRNLGLYRALYDDD